MLKALFHHKKYLNMGDLFRSLKWDTAAALRSLRSTEVPVSLPKITLGIHWIRWIDKQECLFQQWHCVEVPATTARVPLIGEGALLLSQERGQTAGKEKAHSDSKWYGIMDWFKLNIKMNMYLGPMDAKNYNEGWYILLGIFCDWRHVKCFTIAILFTLHTKTYNTSIYFHYLTKLKDQKS